MRTAKDAADDLIRALGLSFGEFSIRVADGKITTLIRRVDSLKPEDLDRLPVPDQP